MCVRLCVCTLGERTVKTLPLTNAAQVEVKGAENKYKTQTYVGMKGCSHYAGMQMQTYSLCECTFISAGPADHIHTSRGCFS